MIRIRAAVFDLDDTLLHDDLSISPRTLEVFHRLHSSGFIFVAASGRTLMSMKPFTDRIGCVSLCIACNGALIWDPLSAKVLHRETFSAALGQEIARFGNEFGCYAQTYTDDHFYFNHVCDYSMQYSEVSMLSGECVGDLEVYIQEPRSKILMIADESKITGMMSIAHDRFDGRVAVTSSKPYFLEFNPLNATKGIALEKTAALLGLSVKDFAAFGDSFNDLSMLRVAGRSVAVSNARREIRSACDDVCLSNQEDGVALYLNDILHKEEAPV